MISAGAISASQLEDKGFSLIVLVGENEQGKRRGPIHFFFCIEGNWELYVFPRLMAAYSEEGSLFGAVPGFKIAEATDRKKKNRKPRGPTAWHRLTTQMSQAQRQKSMKFTI